MPYTVKQVAEMSGVSVRTLHFYDETGLLKAAGYGENGYRFYEEPQLLTLQQILFYHELGLELKRIKEVLGREEFEKIEALEAHREVLLQKLNRTQSLIETIDRTLQHLKGAAMMKVEELFTGFRVAAGEDRLGERLLLGDEPNDCKVSGQDTQGAMCAFEFTGSGGGPRHLHLEQDEWVYVIEGACCFVVGEEPMHLTAGERLFIPRGTSHAWASEGGNPGMIINVYLPAGKMEAFFREVSRAEYLPTREDVLSNNYHEDQVKAIHRLFNSHGMDLLGPPMLA